jgi:tRNA dimethylallyltransferase
MQPNHFPPIICLLGPTASGKTNLSLALAKRFPIEIINVDSAQIYQGLDIGSGKPSLATRNKVPHHLMDILDPAIPYSAAEFCHDAIKTIIDIHKRGRMPLLVGGTMLYFKALQEGLSYLPASSAIVRQQLEQMLQQQGIHALYQRLQVIDPLRAIQIKPTDPQRILRALEIHQISGKTMTQWLSVPKVHAHTYQFLNIGLVAQGSREVLHQRIEERFDQMLTEGLISEVEVLYQRGDLHEAMPAIRAVGYRQAWQYLSNLISYNEMREKSIAATRQLAKRQLTWLRAWPDLQRFELDDPQLLAKVELLFNQQS